MFFFFLFFGEYYTLLPKGIGPRGLKEGLIRGQENEEKISANWEISDGRIYSRRAGRVSSISSKALPDPLPLQQIQLSKGTLTQNERLVI